MENNFIILQGLSMVNPIFILTLPFPSLLQNSIYQNFLFPDVSQKTVVVVKNTMETIPIVQIQTCCIFSQVAYGVESTLTDIYR